MFDIQTRALLLVNINTCSISIDKYIDVIFFLINKDISKKMINLYSCRVSLSNKCINVLQLVSCFLQQ